MYVETVPPPGAGAGGGGGGGDGGDGGDGDGGGAGPGGPGGVPAADAVHLEEASHKGDGRILEIGVVAAGGWGLIYPHELKKISKDWLSHSVKVSYSICCDWKVGNVNKRKVFCSESHAARNKKSHSLQHD